MKINVLSTYIAPRPDSIEGKINQILLGSQQLSMMADSLKLSGHTISQHIITSANIRLNDAKILPVKNIDQGLLTLEILRLHRDYLTTSKEGDYWIVADPDFLFFQDVSHVFNADFDVAITRRKNSSMPYNSGIFFVKNNGNAAGRFFDLQVHIVEEKFRENAQWFADQLVLNEIVENAEYDERNGVYVSAGLRIKLLESEEFNYSPDREHPNLLLAPKCRAYHFKGRCRSYMRYFYKHYVDDRDKSLFWRLGLFFDFLKVEAERKKLKHLYEAAVVRHRPK